MSWVEVEYQPDPIQYPPDRFGSWGPGAIGAHCDTASHLTWDPRHPRCVCGRFIRKGEHACQACGCECSRCVPWW